MSRQQTPAAGRPGVRYWEDVVVGDELPGFSMPLDWTTMVLQVHGSQDWNAVHHDLDFALESGHSGTFYNSGWTVAMFSRALTDWMGVDGWVCRLTLQMRKMSMHGDVTRVHGRVTSKYISENGTHLVDVELSLENDRVGVAVPATASVRLPHYGAS
jgi:acyl dehydratase